jgi:predicted nucleotidyltransferase
MKSFHELPNTRNAMLNERRAALEQLCRTQGVAIMYAFGSRSKELYHWLEQREPLSPSQSDIDIGVRAAPDVFWHIRDKVRLAIALEDLFDCPRVDLIVLNEADPFLAAEVIRGERLFARDSYEADEYDLYVLRRAGDLMPLEQERMNLVLRVES